MVVVGSGAGGLFSDMYNPVYSHSISARRQWVFIKCGFLGRVIFIVVTNTQNRPVKIVLRKIRQKATIRVLVSEIPI